MWTSLGPLQYCISHLFIACSPPAVVSYSELNQAEDSFLKEFTGSVQMTDRWTNEQTRAFQMKRCNFVREWRDRGGAKRDLGWGWEGSPGRGSEIHRSIQVGRCSEGACPGHLLTAQPSLCWYARVKCWVRGWSVSEMWVWRGRKEPDHRGSDTLPWSAQTLLNRQWREEER